MLVVSGCCDPFRIKEREAREREFQELLQKKREEAAARKIEEDAKKFDEPKVDNAELNRALEKARAQDAAAAKAMRKPFADKVKVEAQCASVEIEGSEQDTLHAEGCASFEPPLMAPALFQEAKNLGFKRILNHSVGKAWCSYYLVNFPGQKIWKCNNAGGSWPGP